MRSECESITSQGIYLCKLLVVCCECNGLELTQKTRVVDENIQSFLRGIDIGRELSHALEGRQIQPLAVNVFIAGLFDDVISCSFGFTHGPTRQNNFRSALRQRHRRHFS